MKAGAGKAEIDLAGVLPFDGFYAVRDALQVRALVIEANVRCCIVSIEATSLRQDVLDEMRKTIAHQVHCAIELVWITVTHTFSSPHVRTPEHLEQIDREKNVTLRSCLEKATGKAVCQAIADLAEAHLFAAQGTTNVNVNRDVPTPDGWWLGTNPEGYSNHGVRVFYLQRARNGAPIALLFSVDVQSSVLHTSTDEKTRRLVSGDLAGRAAVYLEKELPGCVALFLTGAAGDQASVSAVDPDGLGEQLAHDTLEALQRTIPLTCEVISYSVQSVVCPGKERPAMCMLRPTHHFDYRAAEDIPTTISVLRLGSATLVGVEPEIPSLLGTTIRALGKYVNVYTLVNGAAKYLPSADSYARYTYEAMNSPFAEGSEQALLNAITSIIAQ